ncbi:MAG TPA: YkgJ family cysteine cluster protein [Planctomycetota bacterium]|nr:YkgJ family cysteine cluster protein [Planctomycetota bacterium]
MSEPADYPFLFACQRSGNCCAVPGGVVRVDDGDVEAIARHLGMTPAAVRSRFVDGDRLRDGLGSRCVFLEDGRGGSRCTIYPVRPEQCRTWPFWPQLLESEELLRAAVRRCPGIVLRKPLPPGAA